MRERGESLALRGGQPLRRAAGSTVPGTEIAIAIKPAQIA
jgi:hypothetical protein